MEITEFGVNVTKKLDAGYQPYMAYLDTLNGRGPAFGTRENSTCEISLWAKAVLGQGEDLDTAAAELADQLSDLIDEKMRAMHPGAFDGGPALDDYAFVEAKVITTESEAW